MKYVDEFRDAELGRAVSAEIAATVDAGPPLQDHGGLRRAHALDLQVRRRRSAAAERRARARPGLPGLRDPDGARRRRHRGGAQPRGDLHLLRRHAARPRRERDAARRQGRGRGRAHGLLAARRAADRAREPRSRRRLLRDRLRDDGAVDGADAAAREGRRGSTNFLCLCNHVTIVPPLRALLESPDLQLDGFIGPGHVATVVGARPFEFIPSDYGKPIVDLGLRAARPAAVGADDHAAARRGSLRGREPVRARRARTRATRAALRAHGRGVRAAAALRVARPRLHLAERAAPLRRLPRRSTPRCATRCRTCASPIPRRASAARC